MEPVSLVSILQMSGVAACWGGVFGNRTDAALEWLKTNRHLFGGDRLPRNHDVFNAMGECFVQSIKIMARAAGELPLHGREHAKARRARSDLVFFAASPQLKSLSFDPARMPYDRLTEQVRSVYGHQRADARASAAQAIVAFVEAAIDVRPLPQPLTALLRGETEAPGWPECYELLFAHVIATNEPVRAKLMFDRVNELVGFKDDLAARVEDLQRIAADKADAIARLLLALESIDAKLAALSTQLTETEARLADRIETAESRIVASIDNLASNLAAGLPTPLLAIAVIEQAARDGTLHPDDRQRIAAIYTRYLVEDRKLAPLFAEPAARPVAESDDPAFITTALRDMAGEERGARIRDMVAALDAKIAARGESRRREDAADAARYRELAAFAAVDSVRLAISLYEHASRLDPDDFSTWVWLARFYRIAGDSGQALLAAKRALAAATNRREQSVACDEIGDVLVSRGDAAGALARYEEGLAIDRDLAARDAGSAQAARDVSVSLNKIGDVLVSRGDAAGALARYEEGLAIARDLAARDAGSAQAARDVSVSLNRIGDVLVSRGDATGALARYDEGLTIARELAARDAGSAQAARDVSVSLNKIGDVLVSRGDAAGALARYEEGLTIRRDLAARDAGSAAAARDVSVSLDRIGDVLVSRGDAAGALARYEEGLTIRRDLAARDAGSAEAARNVSVSLERIGDVLRSRGDAAGALARYEEGLAIRRDLAARDAGSAEAARDVWVSLWRMAEMKAPGHSWAAVAAEIEDMEARGVLAPVDRQYLDEARRLALLERGGGSGEDTQ